MPAPRFIKHGGAVTFSDTVHHGGFESARSLFVEYLDLLQDIGKLIAQNLRVLSVADVEDGPVG
jgi:hypothetical protein